MQYIDIHGHYAWDIDDGMPNRHDALEALQIARQNNITKIVATPHIVPGSHTVEDIQIVRARIQELKQLAKNVDIKVYEGCEFFLNHDYLSALQNNVFIPIENTQYLLVEFDVRKELGNEEEVEDFLYEIEMLGYIPIVAHIERYFKQRADLKRIQGFIDNGYIIQMNGGSLLGVHGKTVQKNAFEILDQGLVHVIATDTHRCEGRRVPCMQTVYNKLCKTYGDQMLRILMYENPCHIINNEKVKLIESRPSFFKKLFKRR